ncbi:hypothetical protein BDL97_09G024300 [Sphagnum fallax]|nr:hypothetical protein BDL97_09G024300 [Sphagnum fallax]
MEASYRAVHPVGVPPQFKGAGPPATRMKDLPGSAGTLGGMGIRFGQFAFALTSFSVMITIPDFSSVTAFCFLVAAMVFQCMWSLSMGILDGYAILSGQCLHNSLFVSLFVVGDWVTSTITFSGACATAGITVLIDNDLNRCGPNHCSRLEAAVAMAFLSWIMISLSFFFSFWLLSSRYHFICKSPLQTIL